MLRVGVVIYDGLCPRRGSRSFHLCVEVTECRCTSVMTATLLGSAVSQKTPTELRACGTRCVLLKVVFQGHPLFRSTVQGAKWTSRGTETSKITPRWEPRALGPDTGICFPSLLSCCLQRQAMWVQTAFRAGVGHPHAQPCSP